MAIEVSSSAKSKIPLWIIVVFAVDAILAIVFVSSYFYFSWSEKQSEQALVKTPQEEALENEIIKKQDELVLSANRIGTFGTIISDHKKVENIFTLLEKVCLPNVWFSDFGFVSGKNEVSLKGEADSFVALGNQISVLKGDPSFATIDLLGMDLAKGSVSFSVQALLDPKILNSLNSSSSQ